MEASIYNTIIPSTEGTTLVAARQASRRGIGYDTEPQYVQIARDRLRQVDTVPPHPPLPTNKNGGVPGARAAGRQVLEEAGFEIVATSPKLGATGVRYEYLIENQTGQGWYVDVAGGFTTVQPGMRRPAVVWETLGKAHVLHQTPNTEATRVLVLTPQAPKPGGAGHKAVTSVGPQRLFDIIEMANTSDLVRLKGYGTEPTPHPAPGFWTAKQLRRSHPPPARLKATGLG